MTLELVSTLPIKLNKIEALERFYCLRVLNLSNNNIAKMENLSRLYQLKILNLEFNQITVVENLEGLTNLEELFLAYNAVSVISPKIKQLGKLRVLDLSFNMIDSIGQVRDVLNLSVEELSLQGNGFVNRVNYVEMVRGLMAGLVCLDKKMLGEYREYDNVEGELNAEE